MSIRNVTLGVNHHRFEKDVRKLLEKHAGKLQSDEMLALASKMVGMIMALQDQRTMTPARALAIVTANIESGNQSIMHKLLNETAGTA